MEKLKVKVLKPFMYNGTMLRYGQEVELDFNRAVRHMRFGDVERNEDAIKTYKARLEAEAQAQIESAKSDW